MFQRRPFYAQQCNINKNNLFGERFMKELSFYSPWNEFFNPENEHSILVNFYESPNDFMILANTKDIKKEDIEVMLKDNHIIIQTKQEESESNKSRIGKTIRLSGSVDEDSISAEYNDGILCIKINKAEALKPKMINIA